MAVTKEEVVEFISNMTVLELSEFIKELEEKFGVSAAAPAAAMQVSHSHAFFTVTGLFSYVWMAIIPLLITAFLLFDAFAHKLGTSVWLALICGILGVAALLTVPAIFTGALTLMSICTRCTLQILCPASSICRSSSFISWAYLGFSFINQPRISGKAYNRAGSMLIRTPTPSFLL
jgi:Ribosomal protein L7/L12